MTRPNWPQKVIKPFIPKDFIVVPNLIEVAAENSPHKGREIVVYTAEIIQMLKTRLKVVFNAILQVRPREVIRTPR